MKIVKIVNLMMGLSFSLCTLAENDWRLVWSDEFETDGPLDSSLNRDMHVTKKPNGINRITQSAEMDIS